MAGNNGKKDGSRALRSMAMGTTISTELAITLILGAYGGHYLDGRLHTSGPWFTMAGSLIGLAVGIVGMIKTLQSFYGTGDDNKIGH